MTKHSFTIDETNAGIRVDKFLADNMPDFSRAQIQRMEKNLANSHKLKTGDIIEVIIPAEKENSTLHTPHSTLGIKPSFPIIYEDADIIVVDKPRGMVMYPAVGNSEGTLVQELLRYCPLSTLGGDTRPGVVHRLDKDTSGCVILAKTDPAFTHLSRIFSEHDLTRKYIAFVWGVPHWESADIEGNIARSSRNRQKMSLVKTGGRPAKTEVNVVNIWPRAGISELRCKLFTGRTHQIRVHLSTHGFGVVSDPTYGRSKENKIKPSELLEFLRTHQGQCLHAEILELSHPITGEPIKFRAPLPNDLQMLKSALDEY